MPQSAENNLSRREREILDLLHHLEEGSATEVREALEANLSDSSVRTFLRRMEEKGVLQHREQNGKFIYRPRLARQKASRSALIRVLDTFFSGSITSAVASLLDSPSKQFTDKEIEEMEALIRQAKERRVK